MSTRSRAGDLFYLVLGLTLGLSLGVLVARFWLFRPKPLVLEVPTPPPPPPTPTPSPIEVYITGAVARPGVYSLPPDARVEDAVSAAGGLTGEADAAAINLAQPLRDGDHVHIPAQGEEAVTVSDRVPRAAEEGAEVQFPVDVNTAPAEALEAIPGIGPAMAARIIEGRPYGAVDDLLRVRGIGPTTLEKIRPYVTVEGAPQTK